MGLIGTLVSVNSRPCHVRMPERVAQLQVERDQITAQLEQQLQRLSSQVSATQKHSDQLTAKLAAKQRTCMDAQQLLVRASTVAVTRQLCFV